MRRAIFQDQDSRRSTKRACLRCFKNWCLSLILWLNDWTEGHRAGEYLLQQHSIKTSFSPAFTQSTAGVYAKDSVMKEHFCSQTSLLYINDNDNDNCSPCDSGGKCMVSFRLHGQCGDCFRCRSWQRWCKLRAKIIGSTSFFNVFFFLSTHSDWECSAPATIWWCSPTQRENLFIWSDSSKQKETKNNSDLQMGKLQFLDDEQVYLLTFCTIMFYGGENWWIYLWS